ncbi:hypothetical protein [Rhodoferax sp.]|uniref:hypothetical protein n=1 Tax=Rhodoferax sp. TaxID=50421 RepID=UPI002601FDDD|nr:hypothetical protein [Rhodoferax sp.]MDD2808223.1 hypothetical protein [Rhodoferax sp.]MDD4941984.1 hypothetical protein [Rhodoferax sp.]MDD5480352.1 hypothetical protein [Rhodoferax sp.]
MKLSPGFMFLLLPLALFGVAGENSLLGLLAVSVLGAGIVLLWRPGVSPILLFVFGYQWLQVSIKVFQANLEGLPVDALSQLGGAIEGTIVLSLFGLLVLAAGMRLGAGPALPADAEVLRADVAGKSGMYWFRLYVTSLLIAMVAQVGARAVPGLSQPFLALASLKWAFYWAFTYATFSRQDGPRQVWLMVFALELLLGFGAYFSDFKTILFMTIFGLVPAGVRLTAGRVLGLATVAALTLTLGVVWSAVKPEYRNFLSQGERAQVVSVGLGESIGFLLQLVDGLDGTALVQGANTLADRIAYVDIFARTIDYVPASMPHQNGAVWGDAVLRPFMPRLFFPEKTAINDSEFTNQFTGLGFSGASKGTSISIGYMGEAYIDFGYIAMLIPIFLLGLALGWFYKWMNNHLACRGLIGTGLATIVLYPASQFETSITKLIGGLVVSLLIAWIVARWGTPYMHKADK